eukprot:764651-Hanusia_phi.AAC.3
MEPFDKMLFRSYGGPVIVASAKGGVTIEDIAAADPSAIIKEPVDISTGLKPGQAEAIAKKMNFSCDKATNMAANQIKALYDTFIKCDCTMVEVNPFTETPDGEIVCVDAKVNFDDNAEFRQKDIHARRDHSQEDPLDVEAAKFDLNFINLDGNIACLVNGAGLAMATMDIIKLHGGEPANFLDLGGSVKTPQVLQRRTAPSSSSQLIPIHLATLDLTLTALQVVAAFRILNSDPKVKGILVNIFGGIVNCATVAQGIVDAAKEVWGGSPKVPLVVRLQGNNVEGAMELMKNSGIKCILGEDLDDAATKVVAAVANLVCLLVSPFSSPSLSSPPHPKRKRKGSDVAGPPGPKKTRRSTENEGGLTGGSTGEACPDVRAVHGDIDEVKSDIKVVNQKIDQVEREIDGVEQKINKLEREVDGLNQQIEEQEDEMKRARGEIGNAGNEKEKAKWTGELEQLAGLKAVFLLAGPPSPRGTGEGSDSRRGSRRYWGSSEEGGWEVKIAFVTLAERLASYNIQASKGGQE